MTLPSPSPYPLSPSNSLHHLLISSQPTSQGATGRDGGRGARVRLLKKPAWEARRRKRDRGLKRKTERNKKKCCKRHRNKGRRKEERMSFRKRAQKASSCKQLAGLLLTAAVQQLLGAEMTCPTRPSSPTHPLHRLPFLPGSPPSPVA